ncbi:MAG: DUF167 domain-containing protein [Actinomycetota bacterium]|nr:DUF167 domain-containing protein [Actinomycetota bacterium]
MDVDDLYSRSGDDAVVLQVHLLPGAGRSAIIGRHGAALKLKVAAPPQDGRANEACASLLADTFGVAEGGVELVGGATSRSKRFKLTGIDLDDFGRRLEQVVEDWAAGPGPDGKVAGRH